MDFSPSRIQGVLNNLPFHVPPWFLQSQHYHLLSTVNVLDFGNTCIALIARGVSVIVYKNLYTFNAANDKLYARASPRRAQSAALLLLGAVKYRALGLTRDTVRLVARLVWAQRYEVEWLELDYY